MSNVFEKLAEKIGIVIQPGGILNIENFSVSSQQKLPRSRSEKILIEKVSSEVYSRLNQSLLSLFINLEKEYFTRCI